MLEDSIEERFGRAIRYNQEQIQICQELIQKNKKLTPLYIKLIHLYDEFYQNNQILEELFNQSYPKDGPQVTQTIRECERLKKDIKHYNQLVGEMEANIKKLEDQLDN